MSDSMPNYGFDCKDDNDNKSKDLSKESDQNSSNRRLNQIVEELENTDFRQSLKEVSEGS